MNKFIYLAIFILFPLLHNAQNKEINNPLFKERINLLFKGMAEKNMDEVSNYFADSVSYSGYNGKKIVSTILKGIALQKQPPSEYKIDNIERINDKSKVSITTNNPGDKDFYFLFDDKGMFWQINLYTIKIPKSSKIKLPHPVTIPFQLEGNAVNFNIKLNNQNNQYKFLFDTGATSCVLDSTLVSKLNLKIISKQNSTGASGSSNHNVVAIDSLSFGGVVLKDISAVVVDLSKFKLDGIIGYDILNHYVTKIDYDNKILSFFNEIKECKDPYQDKLTFDFAEGVTIPRTEISINLKSGKTFKGFVLMDSGADPNFLLNSNIVKNNNLLEEFDPKIEFGSKSLTTNSTDEYLSTLKSLNFLDEVYEDVPLIISLATQGVHSMPNLLGILGNGILYKKNWIFDYSTKTAYYHQNKFANNLFEYPYTNFSITKENNTMFFNIIQSQSKEMQAGLKPHMEIISVNNLDASQYIEIKRLLQTPNKIIKVKYINNLGEQKKWKVKTTKRLI